jgi:nitrate reductase delta subunit
MDRKNISSALGIASFLLQYPDEKWYELLEEVIKETEYIRQDMYVKPIFKFINFAKQCKQLDLAEIYVKSFDFSNKSSLYLTYHLYNDQPERGMAMLKLKQRYAKAGLELTAKDLPDFLPVVLEFASAAKEEDILKEYETIIKAIFDELSKENSPYLHVLKSVLIIIQSEDNNFSVIGEAEEQVDFDRSLGGAINESY